MKRILVFACALGLSAPMAFADCAYHNAAVKVDKTTTASVTTDTQTKSEELVLLKNQKEAAAPQEEAAE